MIEYLILCSKVVILRYLCIFCLTLTKTVIRANRCIENSKEKLPKIQVNKRFKNRFNKGKAEIKSLK